MLSPATVSLKGVRGGSFDVTFRLFSDEDQTVPYSLAGVTVEMIIDRIATLTDGNGLTIDTSQGSVAASVAPEVTHLARAGGDATRYRLELTNGDKVDFPIVGQIHWREP